MRQHLLGILAGALFALGLGISGMTLPQKVIGFLDVFGDWDPTLVWVIGGAVVTYGILFRLSRRMAKPVLAGRFMVPTKTQLDRRLIGGAALFGVGWGLGGLCPGPALVNLPTATIGILVFVGALALGMLGFSVIDSIRTRAAAPKAAAAVGSPQRTG